MFLLEQSLKAKERSNKAEQKEYAQEALNLLQRSAGLGYFDLGKAEPVLAFIRRLLS